MTFKLRTIDVSAMSQQDLHEEVVMYPIEVGQVHEFIVAAHADDQTIAKGTRVRVVHILPELTEPILTLVVLGEGEPQTLIVPRRVVSLNCRPLKELS